MLKDIKPYFDNTQMQEYYNDKTKKLVSYYITPLPGYKIHHSALDEVVMDEESMMPTGEIKLGYTDTFIVINKNYNFDKNIFNIYVVKGEKNDVLSK